MPVVRVASRRLATALSITIVALCVQPLASPSLAAPVNDDFADATVFSVPGPSPLVGTNVGATTESGEPDHCFRCVYTEASVWWRFTPTATGDVTFSVAGSSFDAYFAVYEGDTLDALQTRLWHDPGLDDKPVQVIAGTTYHVAVATRLYGDTGTISLAFTWVETLPPGELVVQSPLGSEVERLDLGTVAVGATATRTLYVRNVGTGPLTVGTVTLSMRSFASGEYRIVSDTASGAVIPPGQYRQVVVAFEPTSAPSGSPEALQYLGNLPGQMMQSSRTLYDPETGLPSFIFVYVYFLNSGGSGSAAWTAKVTSGGVERDSAAGTTTLVGGDAYAMVTHTFASGSTNESRVAVTLPSDFSATRIFTPMPPAVTMPALTEVRSVTFVRLADAVLVIPSDDESVQLQTPPAHIVRLHGTATGGGVPPPADVARWSGADRYATAAAVSAAAFPGGADVVFVATGANFPDALAGGPAGGALGGPILLTGKDSVPAATLAEIVRLGPQRIVILGGSAAVSEAVRAQLQALVP